MEYKFIKDRDIVLFSFQPWETGMGSNLKDIARELSKFNRILFVNRALDRISLLKFRNDPQVQSRLVSIKKGTGEFIEIQPRLWLQNPRTIVESINWIPFPAIHDLLNMMNNRRLARQINKAITHLGFRDVIFINDNDFIRGRYLKQLVNCACYIFYKRDYMLGVGYFKRHGPRLEAGTLRDADMVVTNSSYLRNLAKKFNPNSFDIGQGCDLDSYLATGDIVPDDIHAINKPIIGYTGFISAWRIDIGIILYIAEKFPEYSVVLVGPVDELFEMNEIKRFKNIYFLGYKPPAELPLYLKYFDVCINPQVLNEITIGNYPRKIDEYLAMGKPVVATDTDAMKLFEPYLWLCKNRMDFVEHIAAILKNPEQYSSEQEKEKRMSFALTHTWTNSIGRLGDAFYSVKTNPAGSVKSRSPEEKEKNWLRITAIYLLIIYLIFVYLKFLFY